MAKDRALVSNDDVASVAVAATTESAPASGRAFRASLLRSIDALASDASRSDGMTAAPLALGTDEDDASLIACFDAFPDEARDEIRSAVAGRAHHAEGESAATDYGARAFVPCLPETGGCAAAAAAVVVERGGDGRPLVWEIVWFAVRRDLRGAGRGAELFGRLRDLARARGVAALLACSTNRALSWWLRLSARARAPVARAVLRGAARPDVRAHNPALRALLGRAEGAARARGGGSGEGSGCFVAAAPPPALAPFYADGAVRCDFDRRGRATGAAVFVGRPYRYGIDRSNHVWFPIAAHKGALARASVVLRVDALPAPPPAADGDAFGGAAAARPPVPPVDSLAPMEDLSLARVPSCTSVVDIGALADAGAGKATPTDRREAREPATGARGEQPA